MDEKIKFIEEIKVKQELQKELEKCPLETPGAQSNPIRGTFMKFVNFKQKNKFSLKDLF